MPDGTDQQEPIAISIARGIDSLPAGEWDACAGRANPTVSHAFLSALEESGSAARETGWLAQHLAIWSPKAPGRLLAAAPLYLKSHSFGEYVFDWSWADAYERAGGRYYPKLQSAVPFTPVPGPRLLVRDDLRDDEPEAGALRDALIAGMAKLAEDAGVSSLHATFCGRAEWERFGELGFLQRRGVQYHWKNEDYASFEDFLARLASRKRKNLRKERQKAAETGVVLRRLTGDDIRPEHWDAFYDFYLSTVDRKWASAYLSRAFFHRLGETMADKVLLVLGEMEGEPVAGALNLIGENSLYGRNWGALARFRFLHFEACYYQAIDFAIERGLKTVEAGAQGEHKIQRGYMPVETYSAHWIGDPGFEDAVKRFLAREHEMMDHELEALAGLSPYRKAD